MKSNNMKSVIGVFQIATKKRMGGEEAETTKKQSRKSAMTISSQHI